MVPSIQDVQAAVCLAFNLKHRRLLGPERCRVIAHPRAVAMYLARRLTRASYQDIGAAFGGRNHVTAIVAVRKIARLMEDVPALREQIDGLVRAIGETPRRAA